MPPDDEQQPATGAGAGASQPPAGTDAPGAEQLKPGPAAGQAEPGPAASTSESLVGGTASGEPVWDTSQDRPSSAPVTGWQPPEAPTPVPGAPGFVFAGAAVRLVAFVIDNIVIWVLSFAVGVVILVGLEGSGLLSADSDDGYYIVAMLSAAIWFAYFVFQWTSRSRATVGMRLLQLQVGNAFDGRRLSVGQAVRRWIGIGGPLQVSAILPALTGWSTLAVLVWSLILLATVASSLTKQGLHDRFAGSAIVEPAGRRNSTLVLGCAVLALIAVVAVLAVVIVSIMALGFAIQDLEPGVGTPI